VRLGEAVRAKRKARGWSQQELAEKLGWHRESVLRIELAQFSPSLHRLLLLADALGLPASALVAAAEQSRPGLEEPVS
jgi:transcriptional regulator with XRE-family HTH domain